MLSLAVGASATAFPGPPPLRDYVVDAWSSRNGLPHNSLRDIAQTPEGYLWFATWEGAVRYNGAGFTVIARGTQPGLRDNGIGSLYVDPHGRLWLSDSRGNLGRQQPDGQWAYWARTKDWPEALIHDMAMDSRDRLWLLFEGHGLGCVHPDGRFEYFAPPPGIPLQASFPRMAIDAQDRIWVGTLDGLAIREPDGRWHRAPARFDLPHGLVWPYLAPDGAIWLLADGRVYRMQAGEAVPMYALPGLGHFTAMLQDRNGDIWLGTENKGILRAGSHGIERLSAGDVLPNGRIASLLEDDEGSIWVGANGGLFRLRETLFGSYTRHDGLSGDYVRAVLEDSRGVLWIGGGGGLDRMDGDGTIRPVPLGSRNADALSVLSLAEDHAGDLWVGTYTDGVFHLRDGRPLAHYGPAQGLPSGHVRALVVDDHGAVWAGTRRGLARLEAGRAMPAEAPDMPQGLITALANIDGALWIGSVEGASVLRGDRVERLALERLGGARSVFGFQKVGQDVWIATDRGLYRYRNGRLTRVGLEQGLPVDTVFQLVADRFGNAWISSNRGVLRVRLDELQATADGRRAAVHAERYTEADGLVSSQANGSSAPAAILRRDGTLWVATAAGLATADPARLPRYLARPPPPVVIEDVQLDSRDFPWRRQSSLPGGERINVAYVALGYVLPERIRYRTRLVGLDHDWIERGQQRNVEFIGLPPGDYTLLVSAAQPGGEWSTRAARWEFTIRPLWWQRRDTQAALAFVVLLGLFALYRYRVRRYRARNLRLARLVDERTRDLREQAERLLTVDRERNELLQRLREQAEGYSRQAREDALTGLPNRRHFDEVLARHLAQAARGGHRFSLALLDIDHFKRVNDTYSHSVGDAVLKETAQVLAVDSRASDLLARLGGEEFALLLPDAGLEEARALCERLQESVRERRHWAGIAGLRVTFSAGVAEYRAGDSRERLMQRADVALYRAKSEGRDLVREG